MKQKVITINGEELRYRTRTHPRAKRIRITVEPGPDAQVIVTVPRRATPRAVERFVRSSMPWIRTQQQRARRSGAALLRTGSRQDYLNTKEEARQVALELLERYAPLYNLTYNRVSIRDQKTRWGSCSSKGNLNFNYRIVHLPQHLRNYIVVHELCHLLHMNHSPRFWSAVEQQIPNARVRAKELRSL